jgi:hypothetical protein
MQMKIQERKKELEEVGTEHARLLGHQKKTKPMNHRNRRRRIDAN